MSDGQAVNYPEEPDMIATTDNTIFNGLHAGQRVRVIRDFTHPRVLTGSHHAETDGVITDISRFGFTLDSGASRGFYSHDPGPTVRQKVVVI